LSYHGVLARGFALVRGEGGQPLRAAATVTPGLRLDIEFADGHVGATADGTLPSRGGTPGGDPVKPKPRRIGDPGQGTLF
jgi:exodeoxyribonuclease VII large subunit